MSSASYIRLHDFIHKSFMQVKDGLVMQGITGRLNPNKDITLSFAISDGDSHFTQEITLDGEEGHSTLSGKWETAFAEEE